VSDLYKIPDLVWFEEDGWHEVINPIVSGDLYREGWGKNLYKLSLYLPLGINEKHETLESAKSSANEHWKKLMSSVLVAVDNEQ